jgi:peroxiredoxin
MRMNHSRVVYAVAAGMFALGYQLPAAGEVAVRAELTAISSRKPAPAFRLANASQNVIPLSRYQGRVVLLDFWATECGGCKVEIPWFMEFEKAYKSKRFEVVGVSMDIPYESLKGPAEAWKLVTPFVQTHHVNYSILMGDDDVTKAYAIKALPVTYLLDRKGRIAAEYPGLVDKDDVERNIRILVDER